MCKKLKCLIILVLLLVLNNAVQGTNYYVSPSGNDGNPGTSPAQAWKTITKVNSVSFSAGDSIFFEAGQTFSGSLYFDTGDGSTYGAVVFGRLVQAVEYRIHTYIIIRYMSAQIPPVTESTSGAARFTTRIFIIT